MNQYITPVYNGRLGNQLFQIATALGTADKQNKNTILPPFAYKDTFSIPEEYFSSYNSLMSQVVITPYYKSEYTEPVFAYNNIPNISTTIQILNGYFQSWKYFDNIKSEIKKYFQIQDHIQIKIDDIYSKICKYPTDIIASIHCRFGDYRNFPLHHPILSANYYINAIKYLKSKYFGGNIRFLWFSDDMKAVKDMINATELRNLVDAGVTYYFIDGNKDYEDMYLMSKCDVNIIANSTFSWWGAYLSLAEEIIAPDRSKWFGIALRHHNTMDLYPNHWKEIFW